MWEEAVWWAFVTFSRSCNGFNVLNTSYTCTLGPYLILFYALRSETTVGKQQHTISLSAGARGCSWSRLSPGVVPPIWRSFSHSCWYRLFRVTLLFAGSVSTPLHRSLWETSARITPFFLLLSLLTLVASSASTTQPPLCVWNWRRCTVPELWSLFFRVLS